MIKSKLFWLELFSGALLIAGISLGFFSISSTVFYLIGDLALLIITAYIFSWTYRSGLQREPLMMGGLILILSGLFASWILTDIIGELKDTENQTPQFWEFGIIIAQFSL